MMTICNADANADPMMLFQAYIGADDDAGDKAYDKADGNNDANVSWL